MIPITKSDRGFQQGTWIPGSYGDRVRIAESSSAEHPHIWLWLEWPIDLNRPQGEANEGQCHLSLEAAIELRDQLSYIIDNHYQNG